MFRVTTKVDHCVGYYHLTEPAFSGLVTTHGMKLMSALIKRDPSCQHHDTFVAYVKFVLSVVTYLDFVKLAFMVLESTTDLPVKYVDQEDAFLTCLTDAARATKCTLQERAEMTKRPAHPTVRVLCGPTSTTSARHWQVTKRGSLAAVAHERYLSVHDKLAK